MNTQGKLHAKHARKAVLARLERDTEQLRARIAVQVKRNAKRSHLRDRLTALTTRRIAVEGGAL